MSRNSIEAFKCSSQHDPELSITSTMCDTFIHINIRDNGPGIPIEYRNKILNTYFTTKRKGTGIGLGISRKLVEEHGGTLCFEEHEGRGAWFKFTLPIHSNCKTKQ